MRTDTFAVRTFAARVGVPLLAAAAVLAPGAPAGVAPPLMVRGATVHVGDGSPARRADVLLRGGRVAEVAAASGPAWGALELDASGLVACPGFVDLRSSVGLPANPTEEASEVAPSLEAIDFVDPADPGFRAALVAGVTTVAVVPEGRAAIGGLVGVLKTDDRRLIDRIVSRGAALTVTLGYEPALGNRSPRFAPPRGLHYRRPANRMGVAAEVERAFFASRHGQVAAPEDAAILAAARHGRLPVFVRARKESDIRTALRLAREFSFQPVVLDAVEAWRHADRLGRDRVPVVLGPLYQQPRGGMESWEGDDARHAAARVLHEAGVEVAIASGPDDPPGSLREFAMLAARHGLPPAQALAAITSVPARLLGQAGRLGVLRPGAHADLVLFDGDPLMPTTRVLAVVVEGRLAWRDASLPEPRTAVRSAALHVHGDRQ